MENSVTETISQMERCPSLRALEVLQQQFPKDFSFFGSLCALSSPTLCPTLSCQKLCWLKNNAVTYIFCQATLQLQFSFAGAEATSRLLLSKLTLRDFVQKAAFRRLQSLFFFFSMGKSKITEILLVFLFSDGEIGQADCNMTIKVREQDHKRGDTG